MTEVLDIHIQREPDPSKGGCQRLAGDAPTGRGSIAPRLAAGPVIGRSDGIRPGCFNPDCKFKITVDSRNNIRESDERNNVAEGRCPRG
jgi:hypothetical protein